MKGNNPSKIQNFFTHVFKDHEGEMATQAYLCSIALIIVRMVKAEFSKYLLDMASDSLSGKTLQKKNEYQHIDINI